MVCVQLSRLLHTQSRSLPSSPDRANAKVMSVADLIAQTNASDSASLQALRMCAWADDALSGRCIAGLIQRGDVASVRHVRKLLRV